YDEAEALAERGRELTDADDVSSQIFWRQARALVQSARRVHDDAERLAREAVAWAKRSDSPMMQGAALNVLADVLHAAGRSEDAAAAWIEALDLYERKEVIPLARQVRGRLAELQATPA